MPFLLLMPSYNQAHFIREAVESVLAQDDPDWELWILDNSTDDTPRIMSAYTDPRIHFIHEPRRMDPGTCLNELLRMAQGEHFSYIHTDNNLRPGYVRHFRKALAEHPLALAYCDYYEIKETGHLSRPRRRPDPFPVARLFSPDSLGVPFAATVALAKRIGGFSSDDLADDCFFSMRADGIGPRVHVKAPLVDYRVHTQSRTELSGVHGVARSIYRSALRAYGQRSEELTDPYSTMESAIRQHVDRASSFAKLLAAHLLSRTQQHIGIWIEGTGPASFWLAWACSVLGRPPLGFRDLSDSTLLGLPVHSLEEPLGGDACLLRPRKKRLSSASQGPSPLFAIRLLTAGHSPLDHTIKSYPYPIMASLLVPLHHRNPGEEPVWVLGHDALAAYMAYGIETLAGLPFAGWISDQEAPFPAPRLSAAERGCRRIWAPPGAVGLPAGAIPWELRGR